MKKIILILTILLASTIWSQENDTLFVPENVKDVIKLYEGWRSTSYKEIGCNRYAVGYGFSAKSKDARMTKEQGNKIFDKKIAKIEKKIKEKIKVPLTEGQFSVLVDMSYNIGTNKILKSTLVKLLNQGEYDLAGLQIKRWCHAGKKVLRGLVRRRAWNFELWNENKRIDIIKIILKNKWSEDMKNRNQKPVQPVQQPQIDKHQIRMNLQKFKNDFEQTKNLYNEMKCQDIDISNFDYDLLLQVKEKSLGNILQTLSQLYSAICSLEYVLKSNNIIVPENNILKFN